MAPRLNQPVFLGRHRQAPLIDQVSDVAEWLVDGAPATSGMDQTLKKLCEDLCARGVPVWRVGLFVRTLHPDYFGYAWVWRHGADVLVQQGRHSFRTSDEYLTSPILLIYKTGQPIRQRLTEPPGPRRVAVLWRSARGRRHRLSGGAACLHRRFAAWHQLVDQGAGRFHGRAACRAAVDHETAGAAGGNPHAAAYRRQYSRHLCGQQRRGAYSCWPDPAWRRRRNPRRDLALRHARLHQLVGPVAAASDRPSAKRLFRLSGPHHPRAWRGGLEIHGRRIARHLSDCRR